MAFMSSFENIFHFSESTKVNCQQPSNQSRATNETLCTNERQQKIKGNIRLELIHFRCLVLTRQTQPKQQLFDSKRQVSQCRCIGMGHVNSKITAFTGRFMHCSVHLLSNWMDVEWFWLQSDGCSGDYHWWHFQNQHNKNEPIKMR